MIFSGKKQIIPIKLLKGERRGVLLGYFCGFLKNAEITTFCVYKVQYLLNLRKS